MSNITSFLDKKPSPNEIIEFIEKEAQRIVAQRRQENIKNLLSQKNK